MIETLWTIFKGILLVFGILVVADVIIQMLFRIAERGECQNEAEYTSQVRADHNYLCMR